MVSSWLIKVLLAAYLGVAWSLAVRLATGRALRKPSEEAREEGCVLQEGNGSEWIRDVAEGSSARCC